MTSGAIPAPSAAVQAPGPVHTSPVDASLAERLAELARLRAEGILTDEESAAAKRHLLER